MLRIKRLKKETLISFREKERRVTSALFLGMVCAISVHLLLLTLFRVSFHQMETPLSPRDSIVVEIDLNDRASRAEALCPPLFSLTEKPHLPSPTLRLPTATDAYDYLLPPSEFISEGEWIEYEALDIDFDDDRD